MKRNGGSQTHPFKNALNLLLQSCNSGVLAYEDVISE